MTRSPGGLAEVGGRSGGGERPSKAFDQRWQVAQRNGADDLVVDPEVGAIVMLHNAFRQTAGSSPSGRD